VIVHSQHFEKLYSRYLRKKLKNSVFIEPFVTLRNFIQQNPLGRNEPPLSDIDLHDMGLFEAINNIYRVVFVKDVVKIGTVVLYGIANTGKTTLLEMHSKFL
jgi:hypothetical protein